MGDGVCGHAVPRGHNTNTSLIQMSFSATLSACPWRIYQMLIQSSARGSAHIPLIEKTIGDYFDEMVEIWPHREAVVSRHEGRRYTYRELQLESNRLASALLNFGLAAGDRVGLWSHNCIAWLLMQLATAKTGIILVNINPAYRVTELEYTLNKSGCKALVMMRRYKTSDYLDMLLQV